jgi:cyclin B
LPTETEDIELLARFKLVGVASLFIASKLEEVYSAPALKDLVTYAGKASRQQVLDMEGTIL